MNAESSSSADLVLKTLRTRTARLVGEVGVERLPQLLADMEPHLLNFADDDHDDDGPSFDEMGFDDMDSDGINTRQTREDRFKIFEEIDEVDERTESSREQKDAVQRATETVTVEVETPQLPGPRRLELGHGRRASAADSEPLQDLVDGHEEDSQEYHHVDMHLQSSSERRNLDTAHFGQKQGSMLEFAGSSSKKQRNKPGVALT